MKKCLFVLFISCVSFAALVPAPVVIPKEPLTKAQYAIQIAKMQNDITLAVAAFSAQCAIKSNPQISILQSELVKLQKAQLEATK